MESSSSSRDVLRVSNLSSHDSSNIERPIRQARIEMHSVTMTIADDDSAILRSTHTSGGDTDAMGSVPVASANFSAKSTVVVVFIDEIEIKSCSPDARAAASVSH